MLEGKTMKYKTSLTNQFKAEDLRPIIIEVIG